MKFTIVHGGQTGVDRGAASAGYQSMPVEGFMPMDECDESGPIPKWVKDPLTPLKVPGLMQRTTANVVASDVILVIVEDRHHPYVTPGSALTLQVARSLSRPRLAVDHETPIAMIEEWIRAARHNNDTRLMVAGPRRSKWDIGEPIARSIVLRLAERLWSR